MEGTEEVDGGLSTEEAFDRLLQELTAKLQAHSDCVGKNWGEIIRASLSTRSRHTTITWSSLLILFVESIITFTLYSSNYSPMWSALLPEAIVMLLLLLMNVTLVIWENYKRVNELPVKLDRIINQLKDITSEICWEQKNYPDLYMPVSPCITLQWCYRDGNLVNLPWALLVPGDRIALQPAEKIVAECKLLNGSGEILRPGDIYSPPKIDSKLPCGDSKGNLPPRLHHPSSKSTAIVTSSPYIEMVDLAFKNFLIRPPTFYNKERHLIVTRIIECILLPLAIMSFVVLCLVRMFYLPHWLGIRVAPWADIILLQPMASTFPLLPVALPSLWTLLQCIGNSRLWKGLQGWGFEKQPLDTPDRGEKVVLNRRRQQFKNVMDHFHRIREFFVGREETLHRSQKVLHVLASATALCCVDKKGILSWPNPTADKVFFFRTVSSHHQEPAKETSDRDKRRKSSVSLPSLAATTIGEVLDITIDNNNELHFDDTQWENYISNLKPLGLNILLNTCNSQTQDAYSSFHSHITDELLCNKGTNNSQGLVVPVTSRRCLCEVAKMIGFADKATNAFSLEQELCSFRHIESDQISRDKLTKAKIKFPFPHMMSIIVKEKASQGLQLLAQGTGDIVLDVCDDFWDGKELRPMTENERKLIADFYQRSSLSSICSAFAYKPVSATVSKPIASFYMELPPSKGLRFYPLNLRDLLHDKSDDLLNFERQDSYISTDCLLADGKHIGGSEVNDLQGYLGMQTGQIFLGMVTMQYQACMDIVQLIEQLDQGCIRFVHFSKENELRSRVFSEKMGLESGWNCHISLTAHSEELNDESNEDIEQIDQRTSIFDEESTRVQKIDSDLKCKNNRLGQKRSSLQKTSTVLSPEETSLLPRCSASVPEMVLLAQSTGSGDRTRNESFDYEATTEGKSLNEVQSSGKEVGIGESPSFGFSSDEDEPSTVRVRFEDNGLQVGETARNNRGSPPAMDSCSSAILSPDSFKEVYEMVEHPTPLGFDMSNTAQLPVGIENIRPHLESVDNVPLLVSLFTDCTADNTCEMISIMQDYGEVTLLLGSVCNIDNKALFLQADASVAVEPMYPQCCQRSETFVEPIDGSPTPTDIAMLLTSLPCSLSLKRKDCSVFYDLIAQARHFMNKCVRNSIQFWICCNVAVTLLGLLLLMMLLPPLYSLSDSIWLSCIIIPALTVGLAFSIMSRVDISVMNAPSWKNHMVIDQQMIVYAFWCYGMKFIPSIVNVTAMAAFNLRWICQNLPNTTCLWVYPVVVKPSMQSAVPRQCISTWSCENFSRLLYVQQFSVFFLVLYFVVISACFVYRSKYLWIRNPAANKVWVSTALVVLILQTLYSLIKVGVTETPGFHLLPVVSYVWGFMWAPVALALNELIRRHEIKVNIRYEKRARLDFGTKLGMNSPF